MVIAAMKLKKKKKKLVPWKENYDKSRYIIKAQRHDFDNKGPHSQSYGFSNCQVWV